MGRKNQGGFGGMKTPYGGGMSKMGGPMRPYGQALNLGAPRAGLDTTSPPMGPASPIGPVPNDTYSSTTSQNIIGPAAVDPRMGGNFSQGEGVGATMTPEQLAGYGDPEKVSAPVPPYAVTSPMDPGRQLSRGVPEADPWAFMYGKPPPPAPEAPSQGLLALLASQLTPEQVYANSQRGTPATNYGPKYDAAGNLIGDITRWTGY